jgi:hypothetical protein
LSACSARGLVRHPCAQTACSRSNADSSPLSASWTAGPARACLFRCRYQLRSTPIGWSDLIDVLWHQGGYGHA